MKEMQNQCLLVSAPPVFRATVSSEHSCWKTGFILAHCVSCRVYAGVPGTCTAAHQGIALEEWLVVTVLRAGIDPN